MGWYMVEKAKQIEMSQVYLDLASECFNKAARAEQADAAETLRRMGRCYVAQAAAFDPSLSVQLDSSRPDEA
jgi:hypothetical protein